MNRAMRGYDLHAHSRYSDGVLAPAVLVERAAGRGVHTLALTDHDEVGGIAEAREAAAAWRVQLIAGVEVSAAWGDTPVHVVGLNIDVGNAQLKAGLQSTCAGRGLRAERIASALEQLGIEGALDGARRYAANGDVVGRAHFARYLVEVGAVGHMQAGFERYLGAGKPAYVEHVWPALADAISWIRAAGGMAVLAHPGRYKLDSTQQQALLQDFAAAGGAGVEVVTGSHPATQFANWAGAARDAGLMASAGSDFHSPSESRLDLGQLPALPAGTTPVWEAW